MLVCNEGARVLRAFHVIKAIVCLTSCFPFRDLLIFARSYSEVAWSCSEFLGSTPSIFARSCSELVGIVRTCSEKKRLSNQSHSKCTDGTVYKVKTSKLENIVKPAQCVEKILCTRLRILNSFTSIKTIYTISSQNNKL